MDVKITDLRFHRAPLFRRSVTPSASCVRISPQEGSERFRSVERRGLAVLDYLSMWAVNGGYVSSLMSEETYIT